MARLRDLNWEEFDYKDRTFFWATDWDDVTPFDLIHLLGTIRESSSDDKAPGEKLLHKSYRERTYYDYQSAIRKSRKEGLKGPDAVKVVNAEFDHLQGWYANRWHYVNVWVCTDRDDPLKQYEVVGGVEDSDDEYLAARDELAAEITAQIEKEAAEKAYAQSLGIPTVGTR